ncbi:MAG: monovalent cation/H(+) antiporter subunit G [Armatimonadota bacterium]
MREILAAVLMLLGSGLALIASIGVIRMPDMFSRMQASSKAGTLGVALAAAGAAVYFHAVPVTSRALLIIVFFLLTAPVAAHIIARSAYLMRVPMWAGTLMDEWRGRPTAEETGEKSGSPGSDPAS